MWPGAPSPPFTDGETEALAATASAQLGTQVPAPGLPSPSGSPPPLSPGHAPPVPEQAAPGAEPAAAWWGVAVGPRGGVRARPLNQSTPVTSGAAGASERK